jgi:hypothetical protein
MPSKASGSARIPSRASQSPDPPECQPARHASARFSPWKGPPRSEFFGGQTSGTHRRIAQAGMAPAARALRASRPPRLSGVPGCACVASALLMFPSLIASSATALLRTPPLCFAFPTTNPRATPRNQLTVSMAAQPTLRVSSPCCLLLPKPAVQGGPSHAAALGFGNRAYRGWRFSKESVSATNIP